MSLEANGGTSTTSAKVLTESNANASSPVSSSADGTSTGPSTQLNPKDASTVVDGAQTTSGATNPDPPKLGS